MLAILLITVGLAATSTVAAQAYPPHLLVRIHHWRNVTWKYEGLMGNSRTPYYFWADRHCENRTCRNSIRLLWLYRAEKWYTLWKHIGTATTVHSSTATTTTTIPINVYNGLMCIHSYEGSMTSYNPAGPYYGGWQMDQSFMEAYGSDMLAKYGGKDARYWTAHEQLMVAYNGYRHRGYSPWPTTAAECGL